jgi:hypothetical protein
MRNLKSVQLTRQLILHVQPPEGAGGDRLVTTGTSGPPAGADWGPSFDEIVDHLGPTDPEVREWLGRYRGMHPASDRPLPLRDLLDFGYGVDVGSMSDAGYGRLEEALEAGQQWGLAEWLGRAGPRVPLPARVVAAVGVASVWWLPALAAVDPRNAADVRQMLARVAGADCESAPAVAAFQQALGTWRGLPRSKPPPPYVGHFCGAVRALLAALVDPPGYPALAESLSFATVAPDGSRRSEAIAAAVGG